MVPSQVNSSALNRAAATPSTGSIGLSRAIMPMVRPSGAALLYISLDMHLAAGAGLVVHDDGRLARNVLAEVAGEQPRIDVVAAAGGVADDAA